MVINVLALCNGADTNAQGKALRDQVVKNLPNHKNIVVDFSNVGYATSSFVNSFLLELIEEFGLEFVKSRVKIVNVSRSVKYILNSRLQSVQSQAA